MFEGRFIERGSADYEAARIEALFNARVPSRYPVAILEAANDDDVVAGVRLAKERGWKVAARSGGHAWAGWSVRDDALLIDLAGLQHMTVDVDNLTATVSPAMFRLNAVEQYHELCLVALSQPLLDALWKLTYGPQDPGPAAEPKAAMPMSSSQPALLPAPLPPATAPAVQAPPSVQPPSATPPAPQGKTNP